MKYTCNSNHRFGDETWEADLSVTHELSDSCFEAEISARGTWFHLIVGKCRYSNFLSVISHNFSCELANFSDVFYNRERISAFLNPVDTESLVRGISQLSFLD